MITFAFVAYLLLHFLLYATVFRHTNAIATEKGIFLYHVVPAVIWAVALVLLAVFAATSTAQIVLLGALHGIYSLTFLELWALADGGYSLAIMDCLDFRQDSDDDTILAQLVLLGTAKQRGRVADLTRLGLVDVVDDHYRLTRSGRVAASAIAFIRRLWNVSMSH
jgi:hypothetical protein